MSGYVIYEGPSLFDKKPIVAVLTMTTTNKKTGQMAQLWILRSDIAPHEAVKTGEDLSVCGGCKHRHFTGGSCYVLPFQGPRSVYAAYKRGRYSKDLEKLSKLLPTNGVRLGAYGDPAMLPEEVLAWLTHYSKFTTGYTHQWKNKRLGHAVKYCQGSVDTPQEYAEFKSMYPKGYTFRVAADDVRDSDEIECLSDSKGLSCVECRLCDGKTQDISIKVHGSYASRYASTISIKEV